MNDLPTIELRSDVVQEALDAINHAFVVYDAQERFVFCNLKYREWYAPIAHLLTPGRPLADLLRAWYGIVSPELTPPLTEAEYIARTTARHRQAAGVETELRSRHRWVAVAEHRTPDGGTVALRRDITHLKQLELKLEQLARYDDLTGLANRHLLAERLQQAIGLARREDCRCAVLFIDLDRIRHVNNTWGHVAGDKLLTEVAARMVRRVRETDTVARRGGDEFIVLLPMIAEPAAAAHVAGAILQAIGEPLQIDAATVHITASIGIAIFPEDGEDQQTLIQRADAAMYHTKAHGRNGYHFYTAAMHEQVNARLRLEARLREALEGNRFALAYQPQIALDGGGIIGVEALLRWHDPGHGVLLPGDFIDVAEETGLILRIGEWALGEACREAREWAPDAGRAPRVAVNISATQFMQPQLPELVRAVLADSGLPPHRLELEVTETSLMHDSSDVQEVLEQLRASGVSIAIDDFGSGYSSLGYLKRFPIDKLKIDKTFIDGCAEPGNDAAITSAIIALGRALNLTVVAEGVETDPQLDFLRARGCEVAQGYRLSPPLAAPALREFLQQAAQRQ